MTVRDILEKMQEILEQARAMPMSQSVLVNRAELLELVSLLVNALPTEFDEAKRVLAERDGIIEAAHAEAERLTEQARAESAVLVSEQAVYRRALAEADNERATAAEDTTRMRRETDDYIDAKLAAFEAVLTRTIDSVAEGRNRLHVRLTGDDYSEPQPEPGSFFADWQEPEVR